MLEPFYPMANSENPKQPWQSSLADAATRVEQELRKLVETVDTEVVPEVRRHSSTALRALSEKLDKLAQHMDDVRRDDAPPPPPKVKP
jgi:hypothetical protein